MKKTVLRNIMVFSLAGLVLVTSGCMTRFGKRPQPIASEQETLVYAKEEGTEATPKPIKNRRSRAEIEPPVMPMESNAMFSASGDPLIGVGHLLRLSVTAGGRMELPEQVKTVSDKGSIVLPLIGSVAGEGLTLRELSDKITNLYKQYIRDPQVSVEFVYSGKPGEVSPWGTVMVSGEVRQAGRVNIPPSRNLTVSQAIQLAGGAPKTADESEVLVFRRLKDGTIKKMEVNLQAVSRHGLVDKDIVLEPGDAIYVPESVW